MKTLREHLESAHAELEAAAGQLREAEDHPGRALRHRLDELLDELTGLLVPSSTVDSPRG